MLGECRKRVEEAWQGAGEGVKVEGVRQRCCTGGIIQLALRIRRGCLRLSLSNHVSGPWRAEQEEEQEEGEKGEEEEEGGGK